MSDNLLPPPPDPAVVGKWAGQIRAWLGVAVMLGIAVPNISDSQIQAYVSVAIVLIGLLTATWSWIEKMRRQEKVKGALVDTAVESARIGEPVIVSVTEITPKGVPNLGVATPVSGSEVRMATEVVPTSPIGTGTKELNEIELRRNRR